MINLLPDQIRANNRYAYRNVHLLRYTVISTLTMAAIIAITSINILDMQRTQASLQKQIDSQSQELDSYKPLEARGKQLSDQLSTINSLLSRQVNFSELLPEIAKIMPDGAILKELNFSTSDILPPVSSGTTTPGTTAVKQTEKPFIIQAGIKDRKTATTLLENIRASKDLFTDADLVDVTQNSATEESGDDTASSKYPYQVTINAYLKKIDSKSSSSTGAKP